MRWLLSTPSIWTLLARRDWPLTFDDSESCELKNSECGRERPRGAGHGGHHALEVAAEAERHRGDLLALDDAAGVGAIRLQRRRVGGDGQHFGDGAGFEREIDADGRVDVDADVLADDLLEPGELGFDAVDAVLQVREGVEAVARW